jgi:hypothetical protein
VLPECPTRSPSVVAPTASSWNCATMLPALEPLSAERMDQEITERLGRSTTLKPRQDLVTSLPGARPSLSATLIARVLRTRSAFSTTDHSFDRSSALPPDKVVNGVDET